MDAPLCPICLDPLAGEQALEVDCGHSYCAGCLVAHLAESASSSWRCPTCRGAVSLSGVRAVEPGDHGRHWAQRQGSSTGCGPKAGDSLQDIAAFFATVSAAAAAGAGQGDPEAQLHPAGSLKGAAPQPPAPQQASSPSKVLRLVALPRRSLLADVIVGFRLRQVLEPGFRGWRWGLAAGAAAACAAALLALLLALAQLTNSVSCALYVGQPAWPLDPGASAACYADSLAPLALSAWFLVSGAFLTTQLAYTLWDFAPFRVFLHFDRYAAPALALWAATTVAFGCMVLTLRLVFEAGTAFALYRRPLPLR